MSVARLRICGTCGQEVGGQEVDGPHVAHHDGGLSNMGLGGCWMGWWVVDGLGVVGGVAGVL